MPTKQRDKCYTNPQHINHLYYGIYSIATTLGANYVYTAQVA